MGMGEVAREITPSENLRDDQMKVNEMTFQNLQIQYNDAEHDVNTLSGALEAARLRLSVVGAAVDYLNQPRTDTPK